MSYLTKKQKKELEEKARPIMEWLAKECHPHIKLLIESNKCELLEGEFIFKTNEYLVD